MIWFCGSFFLAIGIPFALIKMFTFIVNKINYYKNKNKTKYNDC